MRAAVLLLTGCSLPGSDPHPVEHHGRPVEDASAPSGTPALRVQPDAVDFGIVELGDHAPRSIQLENVGDADLVLNELRLAYEEHTLELDWTGAEVLAAGASVDLSLTWSPDLAQALESELRIGSNDPAAPFIFVRLTGVTATPQIQVDPPSVDFGDVPIGWTVEQNVTISNVGYADLRIETVRFLPSDPGELEMDPIDTPVVVPPGISISAVIRYTPDDLGEDHGVLIVESNDPDRPQTQVEQGGTGNGDPDTGA